MTCALRITLLATTFVSLGCASSVTPSWPDPARTAADASNGLRDASVPTDTANACPSNPNVVQTGVACQAAGERCQGYSPCALTWVDCVCNGTAWDCGTCSAGGDASSGVDVTDPCPPEGSIAPGGMCASPRLRCRFGTACGTPGIPVYCDCRSGAWACEIVDCVPDDAGTDANVRDAALDGSVCPAMVTPGGACTTNGAHCTTFCAGWPDTPCDCVDGRWFCTCEG